MGKRGPDPKTKAEHRMTGSWRGKSKEDEIELERPVSGTADDNPPEWLTPSAVEIWSQFMPKAKEMKTFKNADHFTFGLFCQSASDLIKALKDLHAVGLTYDSVWYTKDNTEMSTPKKHPLVDIVKTLRDDYNKYANEFGFNPLSRTKLMIVPYDVNDGNIIKNPSDNSNILDMMDLKKVN